MSSALKRSLGLAAFASLVASCASSPTSYQAAAIEASQGGDQKAAIALAQKEVDRFSKPDQCSPGTSYNCGTLALAFGSLAEYQIMDGDRTAGEISFGRARTALTWMDKAYLSSATGMVYRDVSEAYWKVGDHARAISVFKEGRVAGGDSWLYTSSAAKADAEANAKAKADAAADAKGDAKVEVKADARTDIKVDAKADTRVGGRAEAKD